MQRETRRLILLLLPAGIFFSAFFLIPMAELFLIGGTGKDGWAAYAAIITNANYFNSLLATLGVAVLTTVVTLMISGISGVFLQRHKFPGNAALVAMLTFPLAFPGVVIGFMVIMLAGRQGLIGTVSEKPDRITVRPKDLAIADIWSARACASGGGVSRLVGKGRFHAAEEEGSDEAEPQKYQAHQRQRLVVPVGFGGLAQRGAQQFLQADHRQEGRVLEHGDQVVAEGRRDRRQRLREHHMPPDPVAPQAQRTAGFPLPAGDRLDARTVDLGNVGRVVQAQRQHAAKQCRDADAVERQDVIDKENLDEQGRAADKFHEHARCGADHDIS